MQSIRIVSPIPKVWVGNRRHDPHHGPFVIAIDRPRRIDVGRRQHLLLLIAVGRRRSPISIVRRRVAIAVVRRRWRLARAVVLRRRVPISLFGGGIRRGWVWPGVTGPN